MQKIKWRKVAVVRKVLTCAIGTIALLALIPAHFQLLFPPSEVTKLPTTQQENGYQNLKTEGRSVKESELSVSRLEEDPRPDRLQHENGYQNLKTEEKSVQEGELSVSHSEEDPHSDRLKHENGYQNLKTKENSVQESELSLSHLEEDPHSDRLKHENGYQNLKTEENSVQEGELSVSHLEEDPHSDRLLDTPRAKSGRNKLWKPLPNRGFEPCVSPSPNYTSPAETRGYLLVHANGGLNQMRAGICDMVVVARILNATLVIPELDKRSFWQDSSNFSDVFDEDHFIDSLVNDVKIVKKLPKEFATATRAVKHFRSWSGIEYYEEEIAGLWEEYEVIRAAKSDSRLANNNLPPDIQKLRCRTCFEALRFAPRIEAMGKLLVNRMRAYGPYIALHLRYEKDMLAFSGCSHDLLPEEAEELKGIRENTTWWKVKDIDPEEQRAKGYCPLTPKEVAMFLSALGFSSQTPIYVAAGEIYGDHMADLQSRYPLLMNKEKLASSEELEPFRDHSSQMAALDYIVSVESDIFIPSYSGNMAKAVEGHRRFLGHRKTILPDRKALVRIFDKVEQGTMKEGKNLSNRVIELHKRRQGSPRKRKGPIPGTKGTDRFRSEEAFLSNPLPDCLCQRDPASANKSTTIDMR